MGTKTGGLDDIHQRPPSYDTGHWAAPEEDFEMFHQVFICDSTKDQDPKDSLPVLEQNNLENSPLQLKQENDDFKSTAVGFIQKKDIQMVVEDLKCEKSSINQVILKPDPKADLVSNSYFNTTSTCSVVNAPVILLPQQQQNIGFQPLAGSSYIYQPPTNNIKFEQAVNINSSIMQLTIPQVPLQATQIFAPATPGYYLIPPSGGITSHSEQNMAMKMEFPLTQNKIESDEYANTEASKMMVYNGAVKIQDHMVIENSIVEKSEIKEEICFTEDITKSMSDALPIHNNPDLQTYSKNKMTEISDIKDCTIDIKDNTITEYLASKSSVGSFVKTKIELNSQEYEENMTSDYEDNFSDGGNSSGSDWEKSYYDDKYKDDKPNKCKKTRCENNAKNNFLTSYPTLKTNALHNTNSKCSVNKKEISVLTTTKNVIGNYATRNNLAARSVTLPSSVDVCLESNNSTIPKTSVTPLNSANVHNKTHCLLPQDNITTDIHPACNPTDNNSPNRYSFQLTVPFVTVQNNFTIQFIPQTKASRIVDTLNYPSKNLQVQNVQLIEIKQTNDCKEKVSNIGVAVSKLKKTQTFPHSIKNQKHKAEKPANRNNLKKTNVSDPGLKNVSLQDNPAITTEPSKEIKTLHGNTDDTSYCKECDKYFDTVPKYRKHKKDSLCGGFTPQYIFQCDLCGKRYPSKGKLEAHHNSHTNTRPYKCSDCEKWFTCKTTRHMHYKKMHLNITWKYLCCFCGYLTTSITHLEAHEEAHRLPEGTEVPKPFECLVCGKGFISSFKLQRHKREHRFKKCSKCPEEFKTMTLLAKHKAAAHNIIKTYECKTCGKHFTSSGAARSHRRDMHSLFMSYSCEFCDKGFKRKCNLQQHLITHSEDRPISCSECGDCFKRITHLKQHIAAIHGDGRK